MTLDLTFHMLAMNDNCIQNSWLLIAKDFLIIFSLFLIFSHFLSLFIIFYHFKTFFTTLVVIIYIFKILAKLILANLGTKIDVPTYAKLCTGVFEADHGEGPRQSMARQRLDKG